MSVNTTPIWFNSPTTPLSGSQLRGDTKCEVCVVGAGIAGLTTAYRLASEGKKVLVVESEDEIGAGETGATSAHLSSVIDDRFARLRSVRGADAVSAAYESHAAAIDWSEQTVGREAISCDFRREDGFLFSGDDKVLDILENEADACRETSIPMT